MATAAATAAPAKGGPKELTFSWEGKDKGGKVVRGEIRAVSESAVNAQLRRQVGSSRVDLQACKLEYSIVSPK